MAKRELGVSRKAPLPAKLTAPKLGNIIQRSRLFKLLDAALDKHAIWVSAPAGAGKTTLVASYLAARTIKPLWYQIDLRDADPAAFFAYLRQAVTHLSPRKRQSLPLLSPEYALGLPVYARNFFEQMYALLPAGTHLVFDNFQELPDSSPLYELFPQLITAAPDGSGIFFISRADAPAQFARLRATRQLEEISPEALMLTAEESRQLGKSCMVTSLPEATLDEMQARTRGWIAGLILLLEDAGNTASKIDGVVDEHLFDFFAAEIMGRAAPDIQEFLMRSALLPVMDVASCAALTGNRHAEPILRDLVRRNYFITRRAGPTVRFEFHPLFRNFLLTELKWRTVPEELSDLERLAGVLLAAAGDMPAAVELLAKAGAADELVELVLAQADKLIAEGQHHTITHWLDLIPAQMRHEHPWLSYWLGVSQLPSNPVEARSHFERAHHIFTHREDVHGIFVSWAAIAESYVLMWDEFGGMKQWIELYRVLRVRYPTFPSQEIEVRVQAALFGVLMYLQPHDPECIAARDSLEVLLYVVTNPDFKVRTASNLALHYAWTGALGDVHRVLAMADMITGEEMVSPLSRIMVRISHCMLCWLSGDPDGAEAAIDDAVRIAEQSGVHLLDSYILSQSIYASSLRGNVDAMTKALDKVQALLSPYRRLDLAHYHFLRGWCAILKGDVTGAYLQASQAVEISESASAGVPLALSRLELAWILDEMGDASRAQILFAKVMEFAQATPRSHFEYTARMIMAFCCLRRGQETACVAELERALSLAGDGEYYWAFPLWDPQMVGVLCSIALQHGIRPDYVRALIRKCHLLPAADSHRLEAWPWPVRIRSLGLFSLTVDEQDITLAGRGKTKVIEMLKVIIALGGSNIHEHRLSDVLWPDADGDQAHQNLTVTLHRLRKLIGSEAVLLNDGRISLNPRRVWLDIWDFDHRLRELEVADEVEAIVRQLSELTSRYKGGLLPQEHAAWLLPVQERYRARYLRAVSEAAERLMADNRWFEALGCYAKAIECEPLVEQFYEGLMSCHYHLGQASDGIMAYRRCQDLLASELGCSPSQRMRSVLEQLVKLSD